MKFGGMSHVGTMRSMRLFVREVMTQVNEELKRVDATRTIPREYHGNNYFGIRRHNIQAVVVCSIVAFFVCAFVEIKQWTIS